MRSITERACEAYGQRLNLVTYFKYPGRILVASDNNWSSVVGNIRKSREKWAQLSIILGREGSNPRVSGMLFKAVLQAALLFGSKMWVMKPACTRPYGCFRIEWPGGLQGGSPGGFLAEVWINPH